MAEPEAAVPTWLVGAMICLCGSTLTALGLVLQKLSHIVETDDAEQPKSGQQRKGSAYFLRKWWLLGFLVFTSAQIVNMVAMAMTPQIVLSCLGSWTLVCNTIFAHYILGEKVSRAQAMAVAGLVVSAALVLCFAPRPSSDDSQPSQPQRLVERFVSTEFELLSGFLLACAAAIRVVAISMDCTFTCKGLLAAAFTTNAVEQESVAIANASLARKAVLPASWAMVAAVAGGYTALFVKCLALMLAGAGASTARQSQLWARWETYVITSFAVSCAPTELHCLNLALQCGEAVLVVPTYLALSMLAQLATGAVFFQEYRDFSSMQQVYGFSVGVALTLLFVVMMAKVQAAETGQLRRSTSEWKAIDAPELHVALVPELFGSLYGVPEGTDEPNHVSIAGFGGAIEYLDNITCTPRGGLSFAQVPV